MKTVVVANPHAGNGRVGRRWADYRRRLVEAFGAFEVCMSSAPGDATLLARRAIHGGAERIVVVGGDGTVNEVVNGFFEHDQPIGAEVLLAVWPVGTGCDLARSLAVPDAFLAEGGPSATERRADVGRASFTNRAGQRQSRYFINISSCGSTGLVVETVNATSKRLGARWSFFIGTLRSLTAYRNQRVRLRIDDVVDEELLVNAVAVANGRYFGGGMMVAPHALLDDGVFDIIVVGDIGAMTFLRDAPRLYRGRHLDRSYIRSFQGRVIEVTPLGDVPVLSECDGEELGSLPVRYDILPQAVRLSLGLAAHGRAGPTLKLP